MKVFTKGNFFIEVSRTKISEVSIKNVFYSLISFNNHERTDTKVGIYFYSREHCKKTFLGDLISKKI